jgi:hypothetical protein
MSEADAVRGGLGPARAALLAARAGAGLSPGDPEPRYRVEPGPPGPLTRDEAVRALAALPTPVYLEPRLEAGRLTIASRRLPGDLIGEAAAPLAASVRALVAEALGMGPGAAVEVCAAGESEVLPPAEAEAFFNRYHVLAPVAMGVRPAAPEARARGAAGALHVWRWQ